jgi:hypothetical protein
MTNMCMLICHVPSLQVHILTSADSKSLDPTSITPQPAVGSNQAVSGCCCKNGMLGVNVGQHCVYTHLQGIALTADLNALHTYLLYKLSEDSWIAFYRRPSFTFGPHVRLNENVYVNM